MLKTRLAMFSVVIVPVLLAIPAHAVPVVIDFEGLPAMTFFAGNVVPPSARLSDHFLTTLGVRFSSGNDYVAVVALGAGHATSGVNGIGGTNGNGILTYDKMFPILAEFFDPSDPSTKATTDFVSLRGDLFGEGQTISLAAYDISGSLITTFSTINQNGPLLSVSAPGIHSVKFFGTDDSGGVGVDDFTFDPVRAVPEPPLPALLLLGIAAFALTHKSRERPGRNQASRPTPQVHSEFTAFQTCQARGGKSMHTMNGFFLAFLTLLLATVSPTRANLITNGDFSAGNTGFTSQYGFRSSDVQQEGVYTVGDNPFHFHPNGASFGDHTTGTGLMLIVNGSASPDQTVWQQTVNVNAGTDLVFSGWAASWGHLGGSTDPAPAVLQFFINDAQVGSDFKLPAQDGQWAEFSVSWNSGGNSSAVVTIIDHELASVGNDFAVDDLSFGAGGSLVSEPVTLVLLGVAFAGMGLARRRKLVTTSHSKTRQIPSLGERAGTPGWSSPGS